MIHPGYILHASEAAHLIGFGQRIREGIGSGPRCHSAADQFRLRKHCGKFRANNPFYTDHFTDSTAFSEPNPGECPDGDLAAAPRDCQGQEQCEPAQHHGSHPDQDHLPRSERHEREAAEEVAGHDQRTHRRRLLGATTIAWQFARSIDF